MWLPWEKHETLLVLVKPQAHDFIQTVHPGGDLVLLIVVIEYFQHLVDIVEFIHKWRRIIVSVGHFQTN